MPRRMRMRTSIEAAPKVSRRLAPKPDARSGPSAPLPVSEYGSISPLLAAPIPAAPPAAPGAQTPVYPISSRRQTGASTAASGSNQPLCFPKSPPHAGPRPPVALVKPPAGGCPWLGFPVSKLGSGHLRVQSSMHQMCMRTAAARLVEHGPQ